MRKIEAVVENGVKKILVAGKPVQVEWSESGMKDLATIHNIDIAKELLNLMVDEINFHLTHQGQEELTPEEIEQVRVILDSAGK